MNTIAVKYVVTESDYGEWSISDTGRFAIDEWDAFKLFCKVYERLNDEPYEYSEEEFNDCYEVQAANGDVIVIIDLDGVQSFTFIQA
jgi:hypothetical protein